jgi:hypothetical protein
MSFATFEFDAEAQEDVCAVKMVRNSVGAEANPILFSFTRDTADGLEVAPNVTEMVRALHEVFVASGQEFEIVVGRSSVSLRKQSTNEDFYFVSQEGIASLLPEENPATEEIATAMAHLGETIKQSQVLRMQLDASARKEPAQCKHHLSMCRRFVDPTQSQFDHVRRCIDQGITKLT